MKQPIWKKNASTDIDDSIMNYMAGEDIVLDRELIIFDIAASQAHVKGLESIKILSNDESNKLNNALTELKQEIKDKRFILDDRFEDGHSAIEHYLTEKLGELGKKIHTGRSRNDQVSVATRLYMKHCLNNATILLEKTARISLEKAKATQNIPMPGYTHMQRAVPSSCGMWFASIAESMIDNLMQTKQQLALIDSNPLGTAAGYGVNLPLDRKLTTEILGFSRIQVNPIYTQNSRGKFELSTLFSLSQSLLDIRRYCWDISLFSTQEFDFVQLPENMTTGSSIMPNKRNPDLIELMRGTYASVQSAIVELQSTLSLPSGYQRDLQLTKAPLIRATKKSLNTMLLFSKVIENLSFNQKQLNHAIDAPMHATDRAIELSLQGVAFRDAYRQVASEIDLLAEMSASESLEKRVSLGGCSNLGLDILNQRLSLILDS